MSPEGKTGSRAPRRDSNPQPLTRASAGRAASRLFLGWGIIYRQPENLFKQPLSAATFIEKLRIWCFCPGTCESVNRCRGPGATLASSAGCCSSLSHLIAPPLLLCGCGEAAKRGSRAPSPVGPLDLGGKCVGGVFLLRFWSVFRLPDAALMKSSAAPDLAMKRMNIYLERLPD